MGKNQAKSGPEVKRNPRSPMVHAGKSLYRKATNCSIYRDINLSPVDKKCVNTQKMSQAPYLICD